MLTRPWSLAPQLGEIDKPITLAATAELLFEWAGTKTRAKCSMTPPMPLPSSVSSRPRLRRVRWSPLRSLHKDLKHALALIEPVQPDDKDRCLAFVARAIATTDTARAVALADTLDSPVPIHERVKTAIAYKIGADRPDEAMRVIESIRRENASRWQAEAFAWLAVAVAPRNRAMAFALIDRALHKISDAAIAAATATGYEVVAAAHVAACASQVGYPDMESVVMRIIATEPANWRGDSFNKLRFVSLGMIELALLDPGLARGELKEAEENFKSVGLRPAGFANDRGRWLIATALADLEMGEALFATELAALDQSDEADLLFQGIVNAAKMLATPPDRREAFLRANFYAESWRPPDLRFASPTRER